MYENIRDRGWARLGHLSRCGFKEVNCKNTR